MKLIIRTLGALCVLMTVAPATMGQTALRQSVSVRPTAGNSTVEFVQNLGQLSDQYGRPMPEVLFTTRNSTVRSYFTSHSIHFVQGRALTSEPTLRGANGDYFHVAHPDRDHDTLILQRVDLEFVGANRNVRVEAQNRSCSYTNYYLYGGEVTHVPSFASLVYHNLYPHIDLVAYSKGADLKYDFVVHPGGDPTQIRLQYAGMDSIAISPSGAIRIVTPLGELIENKPETFQTHSRRTDDGAVAEIRTDVRSAFRLRGNTVRFEIGSFDHNRDLVIDPLHPAWGTYFGGSGGEEQAQSPVLDRAGYIYFCGFTQSTSNIATTGAFQTTFGGGGIDSYLSKFDTNGREMWATYYGGSGSDYAGGVALDSNENLILYGQTSSATGMATPGAYQIANAGTSDAYLVKFDSSGARQWATYYGGPAPEQVNGLRSVAVDRAARIYITGTTNSTTGVASATAFQSNLNGNGFDAFVAYFTPTGSLSWSTYYGYSGEDFGLAIATDAARNLYVGGATSSSANFTTSSGFQTVYGGGSHDGFLLKFNASTGGLAWGTYIGGSADEEVAGIVVDKDSTIYVTGFTGSTSGIASTGCYQSTLTGGAGGIDAFIAHFTPACKRDWSTYYGGSNADFGEDLTLDSSKFFISGRSSSTDGIAFGSTFQAHNAGAFDAFLARFKRTGTPIWTTYYGGTATDYGYGCVIDKLENPVMAGSTTSSAGISTPGAFQVNGGGGTNRDGYVVKFCDILTPTLLGGRDTLCGDGHDTLTLIVEQQYQHLYWFDSTALLPWLTDSLHYLLSEAEIGPGHHSICVLAVNGINCQISTDTISFTIYPGAIVDAGPDSAICPGESVVLNSSVQSGRPPYKYSWVPTTGLSSATSANPKATPNATMTYHLFITDAGGCITDDSVTITVRTPPSLTLTAKDTICPGSSIIIGDTATGGISPYSYTWTPVTSLSAWNIAQPTATPATTTTYTVVVTDAAGCQTKATETVVIDSKITPKIAPNGNVAICIGDSVVLRAQKGYASYLWSNGETADSIVVSSAGSFTVSVTTTGGCSGTSSPVIVSISPDPVATITPAGPINMCPAGTIRLTANSGAATYLWSSGENTPSIVATKAGSYFVTITNAAGCAGTSASVIVTTDSTSHPPVSGPVSICVGEGPVDYSVPQHAGSTYQWTATNGSINAGQGSSTITIQWNNASPGVGRIMVIESTSGGCSDTGYLDIAISQGLQPVITGAPLSFCNGDSTTLDAGAGYATYQWSKDGAPISGATDEFLRIGMAGQYVVTVTNTSGCSGSSVGVDVTVFPTPTVPIITQTGDSLVSTTASLYQWTFNGSVLIGETSQIITPAPAGTYTVTITDANGCSSTSAPFVVLPNLLASVTVSVPQTLTANIGDNVRLPITLSNAVNLVASGAKNYVGVIRFNSSMLASVGSTSIGTMTGVDRRITITGSNTVASGTLQTLDLVATLGTDSCTDVIIDTFYWTDAPVAVTRENGSFCENGFCAAGGELRLIDPTGIVSLHQSFPNPATSSAQIDFSVIEDGPTKLILSDLFGREVRTVLNEPLKAGVYSRILDVSGLANGSYLYSLRTPSSVLTRIMQVTH